MTLEEVPIHVLFLIALLGIASPLWRNFHKAVATVTFVILLFTYGFFKDLSISVNYIAYFGAMLSGLSGIYIGLIANIMPDIKMNRKDGIILLVAQVMIISTFLLETVVGSYGQIIYNHVDERHYFLMEIYTPFMICSTLLQVLILLKGGIDGGKRIFSYLITYINTHDWGLGNYKNNSSSEEKLQQRDL